MAKGVHGVSEAKGEVLGYLRNIAKSSSKAMLEKNIQLLKQSQPWQKSEHLRKYFEFWELHMTVRFLKQHDIEHLTVKSRDIPKNYRFLRLTYHIENSSMYSNDVINFELNQTF